MKKYTPIQVIWKDSNRRTDGWTSEADVLKACCEFPDHVTIGAFLSEDKVGISIVQSRAEFDSGYVSVEGVMSIPKVAIKSIKRLYLK
jgi:hypothetical protein